MALDPPLLPITKDQVLHGELATLLEEDDYNLATIVNSKFYTMHFDNYLSLCLTESLLKTKIKFASVVLMSAFLTNLFMWVIMHLPLYPA